MLRARLKSGEFWRNIGLAFGGIVVGAIISQALSGDRRLFMALAALTAITALSHLLAIEDHSERTERVTGLIELLSSEWDSIRARFGLSVHVQLVGAVNQAESIHLDHVSQAMWSARSEILVVDVGTAHVGPDIGIRDDLREAHLERLVRRASDQQAPIVYRRIYQVKDRDSTGMLDHDPVLRRHFEEIRELSKKLPDRVFFGILPRVFPYSWIIIDQEILILELYRYHADDSEPRYDGAIIVRDPSRELIDPFLQMWNFLLQECRPAERD